MSNDRTLTELRAEVGRSRFLAMPIAGAVAWSAAGVFGAILAERPASIALFFCVPAVFPLGILFARFTGEDLLGAKSRNELDSLFMSGILMANLVWAIGTARRTMTELQSPFLRGLGWLLTGYDLFEGD